MSKLSLNLMLLHKQQSPLIGKTQAVTTKSPGAHMQGLGLEPLCKACDWISNARPAMWSSHARPGIGANMQSLRLDLKCKACNVELTCKAGSFCSVLSRGLPDHRKGQDKR
eukprot:1157004-Pelagomonas_calceolata.AAC.1